MPRRRVLRLRKKSAQPKSVTKLVSHAVLTEPTFTDATNNVTYEQNYFYVSNMFSLPPLINNEKYYESSEPTDKQKNETYTNNNILYNMLISKNFMWKDKHDNKMYDLFSVASFYPKELLVLYYFNRERPFVIAFGWAYFDFMFYIDLSTKVCYKIKTLDTGWGYLYKEGILNAVRRTDILINQSNKKKYLFYGFIPHYGHHMIELGGLHHFINKLSDFRENLEAIVIGPADYFNVRSFFVSNYSIRVISLEEYNLEISKSKYCGIPLTFTHYPIENNVESIISTICMNKYGDFCVKNVNTIEITLDIRTHERTQPVTPPPNCVDFYVFVIINLLKDFKKKLVINFTGIFIKKDDIHFMRQNTIIRDIIEKVNSNDVVFNNFICENFYSILKNTKNSDIFLGPAGTSSMSIIHWIYGTKCVFWHRGDNYEGFLKLYIKDNNKTYTFIPDEYLDDIYRNDVIDVQNAYKIVKNKLLQ